MSTKTILLAALLLAGFVWAVLYERHLKERLGRWVWVAPASLSAVFVGFEVAGSTPPGSVSGNIWVAFLGAVIAYYEHKLWKAPQTSGAS